MQTFTASCSIKCQTLLYDHVYFLILDLVNEDKTINRCALGRKVFENKVMQMGFIIQRQDFSCLTFNKDFF